jgi:hypothetical protein
VVPWELVVSRKRGKGILEMAKIVAVLLVPSRLEHEVIVAFHAYGGQNPVGTGGKALGAIDDEDVLVIPEVGRVGIALAVACTFV